MRFTEEMYDKAIRDLTDAKRQLDLQSPEYPGEHGCACCGDSGHAAWECGHNPLYAVACCNGVRARAQELHDITHKLEEDESDRNVDAERAALLDDLHEFLHWLSGSCTYMGEPIGPGKVRSLK